VEHKDYRQCTRCVMDTTSTAISFDEKGVCNFCTQYEKNLKRFVFNFTPEQRKQKLNDLLGKIKAEGKDKPYDCILGISGGMDEYKDCDQQIEL
jgi:hypothetical protein